MTLTKEQIIAAKDSKTEKVEVPEWGGSVNVTTMSGTDRDAFENSIVDDDGKPDIRNARAKLCSRTIVDDNGKRLFGESEIGSLGEKSAKALDRVFAAAQRLNGVTKKDIDELVKNSNAGQTDNSTSG